MRVGRSSAFARVRREAPEGLPARSHTPLAERRAPAHAQSGGPAQVHAPLAGRRSPVTLWRADRRRCTLPYGRRGAGRAVEGGPAQVHAPLREARRRSRCGGRTGVGARSPCGEARRRSRCGGADRRRCTLPLREGARRSGYRGWTGAGAHSPRGEARNRSRCGGRTGMGARSLTGGAAPVALWRADRRRCTLPLRRGAEHRLPVASRCSTYVRTLTINPLDKACQGSLAREIGLGGQGCAAPASPRPHPNPLPAERFA